MTTDRVLRPGESGARPCPSDEGRMDYLTDSPEARDASIITQLRAPFSAREIRWRVTRWSHDGKRCRIEPYASSVAYVDRLNLVFGKGNWIKKLETQMTEPIQREVNGEVRSASKVLVTCTLTIKNGPSRCSLGEAWLDSHHSAIVKAETQAFKRACLAFGIGSYLLDLPSKWTDADEYRNRNTHQVKVFRS